jgi:WD40 repeat protein
MLEHPLSWSPDGTRIASAADTITVQVWDASTGSLLSSYACPAPDRSLYHQDWASAIQWSPDGKYIAAVAVHNVFVWEIATGQVVSTYTTRCRSLAWSSDSKYIASSNGNEVHIWNIMTRRPKLVYPAGSIDAYGRPDTHGLSWSPNGRYMASVHGSTVHIWNPGLGNHIYTYKGHTDSVNAVAWSPDSTRVASASSDETVQVWQAV